MTPAPICCFLSFLRPSKLFGMYALGPVSPTASSAASRPTSAASNRSWAPSSPRATAAFASSSSLLAESWAGDDGGGGAPADEPVSAFNSHEAFISDSLILPTLMSCAQI